MRQSKWKNAMRFRKGTFNVTNGDNEVTVNGYEVLDLPEGMPRLIVYRAPKLFVEWYSTQEVQKDYDLVTEQRDDIWCASEYYTGIRTPKKGYSRTRRTIINYAVDIMNSLDADDRKLIVDGNTDNPRLNK